MKVAIIGAKGQLGTDLVEVFTKAGAEIFPLTSANIRVEKIDSVSAVLARIRPEIVLNTAAYHVVAQCECYPDIAFAVNAVGALNVARLAADLRFVDVYYSTDYVFDGLKRRPYLEADLPNPLNVYAISKHAGEFCTLNYAPRGMVIRISGIYGKVPSVMKGGNFITTMLKLAKEKPEVQVVNDEILTPTPTMEIAEKTLELLKAGATGLFHLTSEGECSWYEFAKVIFETLGLKTPLHEVASKEFPGAVRRPSYSVLENGRYNALPSVPRMLHWKEALQNFLRDTYL